MDQDEIDRMSEDELKRRLRKLIRLEPYISTLEKVAEYEDSKDTFVKHWKGIVITASAVLAAAVYLFSQFKEAILKIVG